MESKACFHFQIKCETCATNIVCFVVTGLVPATSLMRALSTTVGMRRSSPRRTRKQYRLLNPPHARDCAAGGADARDRLSKRLERHSHVEGVGVNERAGIAHDRHMPFPENEIATTQAQLSLCVGGG